MRLNQAFTDLVKVGQYSKPMTFNPAEKENRKRPSDGFENAKKRMKSLPDTPKGEKKKKSIFNRIADS